VTFFGLISDFLDFDFVPMPALWAVLFLLRYFYPHIFLLLFNTQKNPTGRLGIRWVVSQVLISSWLPKPCQVGRAVPEPWPRKHCK
jgi:hypothetical protein